MAALPLAGCAATPPEEDPVQIKLMTSTPD
jgi:hypothetical protein